MFKQAYHLENQNCPTNLHFDYQAEQRVLDRESKVQVLHLPQARYQTIRGSRDRKTSQTKPICVGSPSG
jgi:hypothetical protein